MTWSELERRHGIGERQCQRIVEAWHRTRPATLGDVDPTTIVLDTLAALEQDLSDLAVLSVAAQQESVRLGAIRARRELLGQRIDVLRTIGRLPRDWGSWAHEGDTRDLFAKFVQVARDHLPETAIRELERLVEPPTAVTVG